MTRGRPKNKEEAVAGRQSSGATTGCEGELWAMADALHGAMDAAEYKHVVLGLILLKYISDAVEERHAALVAEQAQGADPEHPDEYRAENIFWVPPEACWSHLRARARQSTVGQLVDGAMTAIERDNPALRDVLPKDYARPALDKRRLGQLIDMVSNIVVGDEDARAHDVLGRVYEYFLSRFASAEGKKGGEFYTPRCSVEMLEPYKGRVYGPCCGSSGMFVQPVAFIDAHATGNGNGGKARDDNSIWGQESNHTTWPIAQMNLAIRGREGQIAHGDSFHNDRHPDLRAAFILANPPFNVSDWGGERLADDKRWRYGTPPRGNANFAWVQYIVHHLAPRGTAGFVIANGSMSSSQSGEGEIRRNLIEDGLVDCMVDRTHRELADEDSARIAGTYHAWRGEEGAGAYADMPGFRKSAAGGGLQAQPHAHPRPLRRRRAAGGRRRALRGQDEAPRRAATRATGRRRTTRQGHRRQSEEARVWRVAVNSALKVQAAIRQSTAFG